MLIQSLTFILYLEHIASILLELRFETFVGLMFLFLDKFCILAPWSSAPIASLMLCQFFKHSHSEFATLSSYRWPMCGGASVYIRGV